MKFKDCAMQAVNKAYEWLQLYDDLNVDIVTYQEWTLMRYIPYLFVTFHMLFSCLAPPRIQFPQSVQEVGCVNEIAVNKENLANNSINRLSWSRLDLASVQLVMLICLPSCDGGAGNENFDSRHTPQKVVVHF